MAAPNPIRIDEGALKMLNESDRTDSAFEATLFPNSFAIRYRAYGARVASLGFAAVICDVIGAYPAAIGPIPMIVCQAVAAAWFVGVGTRLIEID